MRIFLIVEFYKEGKSLGQKAELITLKTFKDISFLIHALGAGITPERFESKGDEDFPLNTPQHKRILTALERIYIDPWRVGDTWAEATSARVISFQTGRLANQDPVKFD